MARHEYINDFFYCVVTTDVRETGKRLICCLGVNIDRFAPLTKGRHSFATNPVIRGLQRVKHGISAMALSKGAIPKFVRGTECVGIAPTTETWYTELLLIEKAEDLSPEEVIRFSVGALMEKICTGLRLSQRPPEGLPAPPELQSFLEGLHRKR